MLNSLYDLSPTDMTRRPRILAVLSADFGEYVNLILFARGQDIDLQILAPEFLMPYLATAEYPAVPYRQFHDLSPRLDEFDGDLVWLGSAYLFAINGLFSSQNLEVMITNLKRRGIPVATTDPWARIWSLRPEATFNILRQGKPDPAASLQIQHQQQRLENLLAEVSHVFPIPINQPDKRWFGYFNPEFVRRDDAANTDARNRRSSWLFVLSNEDLNLQLHLHGDQFISDLNARLEQLLGQPDNDITLIAPERLGDGLTASLRGDRRLQHRPRVDAAQFESLVRRASVTAYWNMLSASLLYCLYHVTPVIFFARGHQVTVCPGLEDHVLETVYSGQNPVELDLNAPMEIDAERLVASHDLTQYMQDRYACYAANPEPREVLTRLLHH